MLKQVQHDIKKVAFTLAEVLIALAIIGVVAAVTIPTLIEGRNRQQWITGTKKAYSVLSQALELAEIDNGPVETWGWSHDSTKAYDIYKSYFNLSKDCGFGANKGCVAKAFLNLSDTCSLSNGGDTVTNRYKVKLSDGTGIYFWAASSDCGYEAGTSDGLKNICAFLTVDINGGDVAPNTSGKDIMYFWITKKGIIPAGTSDTTSEDHTLSSCNVTDSSGSGVGCTAWVIYNGNMDYLDGKVISW